MSPTVTIDPGPHDRSDCPLRFSLPSTLTEREWALVSDDGETLALQRTGNQVACLIPHMNAGVSRVYGLQPARPEHAENAVAFRDEKEGLAILLQGELLTRYVYADVPSRPYFYPVLSPGQIPVTRAYPMQKDVPGETQDHPHHRSLWIAFGEVNGADNWSEGEGHAFTRHLAIEAQEGGPVCGSFSTRSVWTTNREEELLHQQLGVTVWAAGKTARLLDFSIQLTAAQGSVHFGDTKEGGILSVRVASELDVPRTGRITNVYGGINEAETWGKSSHWCDYSGQAQGRPVGIAVFDHPHSFRYPTHWHVRNYGLMTANPFAYAAYTDGLKQGDHILPAGETLSFQYRVVLHTGNCEQAQINARYLDYVAPPRVTVSQ